MSELGFSGLGSSVGRVEKRNPTYKSQAQPNGQISRVHDTLLFQYFNPLEKCSHLSL